MPSRQSPAKPSSPRPREYGQPLARLAFDAIGTKWLVDLWQLPDGLRVETLNAGITQRIASFDKTYSRFRDDSLVTEMSKRAGVFQLPDDAGPLLKLYRQLYDLTGGAVTPLAGQVLSAAGYDAQYSLRPRDITAPPPWEDVIDGMNEAATGGTRLRIRQPALLDFGAAGKGYLVDIISRLIEKMGVMAYCVNAGGDLFVRGDEAELPVALEHPDDPESAVGVARLQNRSLCGSSGNRRAWDGYHHIIDPHSLRSPRHIKAVWTVADSCLVADGLATALFFVPASRLAAAITFEYAMIYEDGRLERSPRFPAEFFIQTTNPPYGAQL